MYIELSEVVFVIMIVSVVIFYILGLEWSLAKAKLGMYTCQLSLRYKREIFILGMLGFLKTIRSFPKIPEEVRSLPKTSEVL